MKKEHGARALFLREVIAVKIDYGTTIKNDKARSVALCFVRQFTLLALHICLGWLYRLREGVRKKRLTSRDKYSSDKIIILRTCKGRAE